MDDFYKNIYFIDNNFRLTDKFNLNYDSYSTDLSAANELTETETISISGAPLLTNIYINKENGPMELSGSNTLVGSRNMFVILGQNFQYTTGVLISSNSNSFYTNLTSLSYTYYPTVSGFVLPTQNYKVMNKNAIHITLPEFNNNGKINFVILNPIGWKDTNSIDTSFYYISSV